MKNKIYLIKIGKDDRGIITYLKENLKDIYPFEFLAEEMHAEIENAFNPIRNQYLATPLILQLAKKKPEDAIMVLGIFDKDLYADGLNFIFGQAEPSQGIAIISIFRLSQEFYSLKENPEILKIRALKEAVHELGHLFGLPHCGNSSCVMFFSNSILDTDRKSFNLCAFCKGKLNRIIEQKFK